MDPGMAWRGLGGWMGVWIRDRNDDGRDSGLENETETKT